MITTTTASNTVILSDLIKGQFIEAAGLYDWHIQKATLTLEDNSQQAIFEVLALRKLVKDKMVSIALMSCYFLESLVNSYGYYQLEKTSENILEDFGKFVNLPTLIKWEKFLHGNHKNLAIEIKDLFEYRNFIVHSKPVRIEDSDSKVYKKNKGWVPVSTLTTYLDEQSSWGLIQTPMSPKNLSRILNLSNSLIGLLDKEYIKHYQLQFDLKKYISEYESYTLKIGELTHEFARKNPVNPSDFNINEDEEE